MKRQNWDHFEHEADIGLRAEADSRAGLFEAMGEALTAVITDPTGVRASEEVDICCEAPDDALLLVDWLNALIFEMGVRKMVFGGWSVSIEDHSLTARVSGEAVDRQRHQPVVEVKGATYTALWVEPGSDGIWRAECVVDV